MPKATIQDSFEVNDYEYSYAELLLLNQHNGLRLAKARQDLDNVIGTLKDASKAEAERVNLVINSGISADLSPIHNWTGFRQSRDNKYFGIVKRDPDNGLNNSFFFLNGIPYAINDNTIGDSLLGKGGMGKVSLCRSRSGSIHKLKKQEFNTNAALANFLAHTYPALQKLKYSHGYYISTTTQRDVNTKALLSTTSTLYLVLEYFPGTNFKSYLESQKVNGHNALDIAFKLSWQVKHLHNQNIVHCDIKPDNIIIDEKAPKSTIRLIDFDGAKILNGDGSLTPDILTFTGGFAPPELAQRIISKAWDIYSLGKVFSKLTISSHPKFNLFIHNMLNESRHERPNINAVIQQLIHLKDEARISKLLKITAAVAVLPIILTIGGFISIMSAAIGAASIGLAGIMRLAKLKFEQSAFNKKALHEESSLELSIPKLKALTDDEYLAFKEGYNASSVLEHTRSWLSLRNYSYAYYAGVRFNNINPELNMQDIDAKRGLRV